MSQILNYNRLRKFNPLRKKPLPPEPKEGEAEERAWRNKAKRFVLERYPELAEYPDLQDMFFRLKTIVYIVNQSLPEMLTISAFRGKEW